MTMARLALRLAAVESLLATGAQSPPTLAGPRVFDSRDDPIDDLADGGRAPLITVGTDEDTLDGDQLANGLPWGRRRMDLRVQFGFRQGFTDEESGDLLIGTPETDAGTEALLDVLEAQIAAALNPNRSALMRAATTKIVRAVSRPLMLDADRTVRIAAREMLLTCETSDDWGESIPAQAGGGWLPEPLASVAALIPAGSYAADILAGMPGLLTRDPAALALAGIDLTIHPDESPEIILASAETD